MVMGAGVFDLVIKGAVINDGAIIRYNYCSLVTIQKSVFFFWPFLITYKFIFSHVDHFKVNVICEINEIEENRKRIKLDFMFLTKH